jgi:hypothetical protein
MKPIELKAENLNIVVGEHGIGDPNHPEFVGPPAPPRYTKEDWELLDEAAELLDECNGDKRTGREEVSDA